MTNRSPDDDDVSPQSKLPRIVEPDDVTGGSIAGASLAGQSGDVTSAAPAVPGG
jgi:hypothetical protein